MADPRTALLPTLPTPNDRARAILTIFDGVMSQLLLDLDEATMRTHFINIATALTDTRLTPPGGA